MSKYVRCKTMGKMEVEIVRDDSQIIRETVERDHYLHRWPDPRSLPFAYRLIVDGRQYADDGRPHGVVVFKKLQHQRQRGLFGYPDLPTAWQILDMARVWVHPDWQGVGASGHSFCMFTRMVSRALRRVQRDWLDHHPPRFLDLPYHIELVISYCEMAHHEGVGYRAASFEKIGVTSDGRKEIYLRRLRPPRRSWRVEDYCGVSQRPFLKGVPIRY